MFLQKHVLSVQSSAFSAPQELHLRGLQTQQKDKASAPSSALAATGIFDSSTSMAPGGKLLCKHWPAERLFPACAVANSGLQCACFQHVQIRQHSRASVAWHHLRGMTPHASSAVAVTADFMPHSKRSTMSGSYRSHSLLESVFPAISHICSRPKSQPEILIEKSIKTTKTTPKLSA